ncbi:MAG: hypothetical protein F6K17_17650 [Okeania sp. SIO3C4]|nr:hypothetical protein [Okeania sp. SIO3C4]
MGKYNSGGALSLFCQGRKKAVGGTYSHEAALFIPIYHYYPGLPIQSGLTQINF